MQNVIEIIYQALGLSINLTAWGNSKQSYGNFNKTRISSRSELHHKIAQNKKELYQNVVLMEHPVTSYHKFL